MLRALLIALPILLILAFAAGIACTFVLRKRLTPDRTDDLNAFADGLTGDMAQYAPALKKAIADCDRMPVERRSLILADKTRLEAEIYRALAPAKGIVILAHGYHGRAHSDFAPVIPFYHDLGWDVLLIEQRAHGRSGGERIGLGITECDDVACWAHIMAGERPGFPVVLDGISMGASAVLMAAGLPLPKEVRGLIADSGFTSPADECAWLLRRVHLPAWLLMPTVRLLAKPLLGFRLDERSAPEALAQNTLPLLLLHGEADRDVPCEMSRRNFEASAAADKTLLTVPGATHGMSYFVDQPRCQAALEQFLARCIQPPTGEAPAEK